MLTMLRDDPIVLVGPPARLAGLVPMHNSAGTKLKLKRAALTLDGDAPQGLQLAVNARLAPGATAHAAVSLQLDPCTPAGELRGQVQVGERMREVVIRVLEHREVAVTPRRFVVHGACGSSVSVPVALTNLGNVPFTVPRMVLVAVSQVQAVDTLFHVAAARAGAEGYEAALNAFAQLLHDAEVPRPRVVFGAGAGQVLEPGALLQSELEFQLPAELVRHGHYVGQFLVGATRCAVEIHIDTPAEDAGTTTTTPPERAPRRSRA